MMSGTRELDGAGLTIGELAARAGVSTMTLRSWEARHGAPTPRRGAGGHRRYAPEDVTFVQEVLRHRDSGLGVAAAIDAARRHADRGPTASLFAALRVRHPQLRVHVLTKTTMLALSRAIEDECCARADRPILFGFFQRPRFYAASDPRWRELARTAEAAFAFADFPADSPANAGRDRTGPDVEADGGPALVPLRDDALMRREWAIVCEAADHPACLVGWERLDPGSENGSGRRFEAIWSADPVVVRDAARFGLAVVAGHRSDLAEGLDARLAPPAPSASADLQRATGLLDRTLEYLDSVPSNRQNERNPT